MLVQVGEGNLFLLLGLTAVICIILGMGMPTTAIYFLLAVLATQPLIDLGVEPLSAHLFVLYFGLMSMITPPVALAAFHSGKACQCEAHGYRVGSLSVRVASLYCSIFICYCTQLNYGGRHPIDIVITFISAIAGIWFTSAGFIGYLINNLNPITTLHFILLEVCSYYYLLRHLQQAYIS